MLRVLWSPNLIYKAKHSSSSSSRQRQLQQQRKRQQQRRVAAGVDGSSRSVSGNKKIIYRGLGPNKFAITSNLKVINTPGNDKTFK